jgi:hypothetical protein
MGSPRDTGPMEVVVNGAKMAFMAYRLTVSWARVGTIPVG